MIRTLKMSLIAATVGLAVAGQAQAADRTTHVTYEQAISAAKAAGKLDGSVAFYPSGTGPKGTIVSANAVTNKKTNAFGKSDEESCLWAAQSALITMQDAAKKAGANAVVNLMSYYKKVEFKSPTDIECHAGAVISGVALKGDLANVSGRSK